jgi:MFS family permease
MLTAVRRLLNSFARVSIDVTALRTSSAFRRLFGGYLASSIGTQVTLVAMMLQMYALTDSSFNVGLLGAFYVVPTLIFALWGGAIADAVDRKKLLLAMQVAQIAVPGTLALLSFTGDPPIWTLYALASIGATFAAIDGPTRTAVIPMLVDAATLRSAVQLREVLTQSGRMFGPVIAGLLIAHLSYTAAYAADALSFAIAFALYVGLPALPPAQTRRASLGSIAEGLRFVGKRPVLASTFVADLIAMVMGMPRAVFPALAATVFMVDEAEGSLLYAAPAAGAMIGLLFFGVFRNVKREGLAVLVAVTVWGASIALIAATTNLWIALGLLAVAGWADMVSAIFRQTILLEIVPDELRGRMGSVHIMVVTGGPPLGDLEAGAAAELLGVRQSVAFGGLACIAGMAMLAWRVPSFARWTAPTKTGPLPEGNDPVS